MGPAALVFGIILCLVAFGTDTAPEGTHNLGLLQQRMMTLHCGLALLIIAAIRFPTAPISAKVRPIAGTEDAEARRLRLKRHDRITYGVLGGAALLLLVIYLLAV